MLSAILFDADGVVQSGRRFFAFVDTRLPQHERAAFINALFAAEEPCLAGRSNFAKELEKVVAAWGVTGALDAFHAAFNDIEVDRGVLGVVSQLRARGLTCCIASNQQALRARHMSEQLGYAKLFDHEFYSHALGVVKPDGAYFQRILEVLGEPAGSVLFIDDSVRNVESARRLGMVAEHFPSTSGVNFLVEVLRRHGVDVQR